MEAVAERPKRPEGGQEEDDTNEMLNAIRYAFEPVALLVEAMDANANVNYRENIGQEVARLAMQGRAKLVGMEKDYASPTEAGYHRAEALLTGIAAAALIAGMHDFAAENSGRPVDHELFRPNPEEAMMDAAVLVSLAEELWPENPWDQEVTNAKA